MKKTLFFALCCAFALASCQKEQQAVSIPNAGEEAMATFTVAMTPATKATIDNDGAAANVNRCILEVRTGDSKKVYRHVEVSVDPATLIATFQLPLVISQTYDFLFWADNATLDPVGPKFTDKYYNTQDLTAVKIIDETSGNLDEKDAFFKADHNVLFTGTATLKEYTLTRPFAQVNIVATDLLNIKAANDQTLALDELWPSTISVNYTTEFPTQFNVSTGVASEPKVINRKAEAVYGCVEAKDYNTLNMDYIFVNEVDGEGTTPFAITKAEITSKNGKKITILENAANIPMKRNYRTNINGKFLTATQDFEVTVNPLWLSPDLHDQLPSPPSPDDPQGCKVSEPDEEGNVIAEYTPGSPKVVVPEGVTKFITNPENPTSEGGAYNNTVESITFPSTIPFASDYLATGCANLMSITYNVTGIDFTLENSFLVFTGSNGISNGETLELNFIGIPTSFKFVKYHSVQKQYIDAGNLTILSQTSTAGTIRINLPEGWISAGLPYQFKSDGTASVVVYEGANKVYPEN